MYIISGCLLGKNCKYNGGNNYSTEVAKFCENHTYILVCPETEGGLPTPRVPVEIINGRAVNAEKTDVTDELNTGCEKSWKRACEKSKELKENIEGAILKAKSPSCGSGSIYDGTFSHSLTTGDGFFTTYLKEMNVKVISELEINLEDLRI